MSLLARSAAALLVPALAQAGDEIQEIIVTATRMETPVSKTPVAVTAVSGDSLRAASVSDPTTLGKLVPNLAIVRQANNGLQITIRGVTSTDNTEKGDPSAAFLLDGITIARPQAQEVSFFDIQRVEVLRGPQGTLYGRNTTAGLVNVISNKPVFDFEAAGNLNVGNYDTEQADAMINVPLNDVIALRAAASYDRRDNFVRKNFSAPFSIDPFKDNMSGRVQALIKPNTTFDILLCADYADIGGKPFGEVPIGNFFAASATSDPRFIAGSSEARRTYSINPLQDTYRHDHSWGVSGEANWNLGSATLTYLGGHRELKRDEHGSDLFPPTGDPLVFQIPVRSITDAKYRQDSHELRLATNGDGPFKGQAGIYYFEEHSAVALYTPGLLPFAPVFGFVQDPTVAKSHAYFGQGTYSVTPGLRLTAGLRYTRDEKSRLGGTVFQRTFDFNPATDLKRINAASRDWNQTTWHLGLDYDLGEYSLLYASISTGYKAGGFNDGCEAGTTTNGIACNQPRSASTLYYDPEKLKAYEVGLKTRFLDNKASLSAAAFHYDYRNLQLSAVGSCAGAPCQITANAGKARVDGVELEGVLALDERDRIDMSATWLDAEYVDYIAGAARLDYSGRRLDRSPKWVVAAGYSHTVPLDNGARLVARLAARYSDEFVLTTFDVPRQYRQPSYTKSDASLSFEAPGARYYVQAYVNNIEDKVVATNITSRGTMALSDPRTYGLRVGFKY